LSRCALVAAWARLACSKSFTDLNSEPQSPRSKTAQHARPLSDLRCCSARRDRPFRLACGAVETITASVMLSSSLHQGHAAFAARSAGTGVYRRPTDADPNTSSACDSKRPPDGLPLQGGDRSGCAATRANIRSSPPNSRPAGVYLSPARRNPAIAAGSDRHGKRRNR
jgi:hypothetical protein